MKRSELEQLLRSVEENGGIQDLTLEHTELDRRDVGNEDRMRMTHGKIQRRFNPYIIRKVIVP